MVTRRRKIFLLLVLTVLSLAKSIRCDDETTKEDDLTESESKDPSKLEIIKQIKRVNEDGSYTFGYEAEDGTFKIESRDVLGNVKGTFGFVDTDGEIKRVSYTTTSKNNESTVVTTTEKEKSSVIQHIPRTNRTTSITSSTRKPLVYMSTTPASTSVVQSIPRRRVLASSNSSASSSTTAQPSYKNIIKTTDFDITTIRTSTAETPRVQQAKPAGHYIRSTVAPLSEAQRYIEGQLIRPTQPATVTTHPSDIYPRRFHSTRNPFLDERISTIKPLPEETVTDSPRGNILRRQLNQEKVFEARQIHRDTKTDNQQSVVQIQQPTHFTTDGRQHLVSLEAIPEGTKIINFSGVPRRLPDNAHLVNFDAREHMIHLQQSIGEDATDVYSASLTTGTPRPLFTTTERPFPYAVVNQATRIVTPVKYTSYQKSGQQSTTTDTRNNLENTYPQPSPVPLIQVANGGEHGALPFVRTRHPFHGGAILIPVNHASGVGSSFVIEEQNDDHNYAQFVPVPDQQYQQRMPKLIPVPYLLPKRRPIPLDFQPVPVNHRYLPKSIPISLPSNPMKLQDEIDNIKPPVSTNDFQKLLNRLILRQSQLQEISRLEHMKMFQKSQSVYSPVSPTPVSVFVRTGPDTKSNTGPVQFVEPSTNTRNGHYITIPQAQTVPVQKLIDSQPDYDTSYPYTSENYSHAPRYRLGRRSARLNPSSSKSDSNEDESYLPPDVREMLLLRMLQLAINPNLPLPPSEGEEMSTAIKRSQKEAVRNVQIIGEEPDDDHKPVARNKRYPGSSDFDY